MSQKASTQVTTPQKIRLATHKKKKVLLAWQEIHPSLHKCSKCMGQMEKQIAIKKLPALTFLGLKMLPKGHNCKAFKIWSTNSLHRPHQIVRNSTMFTRIKLMEKTENFWWFCANQAFYFNCRILHKATKNFILNLRN